MGIFNTCLRIVRHRSKEYFILKTQLNIFIRLVRDISVHEDNVPSVKYTRNSHVCLFAFLRDYYSIKIFLDSK